MSATMPSRPALQARRHSLNGDTVLELQGRLDSSLTAELREEALSLIEPGCRLVLDLSELVEMSPTGVRSC
jgi:anti-anti-sigma regulatory factor